MEIHFEINNQCMLVCRHCSSNASDNGADMQYTINDMLGLLQNIPEQKVVFLTGGEPFLSSNFLKIVQMLTVECENINVGVFTTGIINNNGELKSISLPYARRLSETGLKICYVSIYSSNERLHDWMTGVRNSFQLTKASVMNMVEAGIDVRFNTVVTRKNYCQIKEIFYMAKDWGVTEVRLLKLVKQGRAGLNWEAVGIGEDIYIELVKNSITDKYPINIKASSAIDFIACRPLDGAEKCQAGSNLLYVTYKGDIFPCASLKGQCRCKIASIRETEKLISYLMKNNKSNNRMLCETMLHFADFDVK